MTKFTKLLSALMLALLIAPTTKAADKRPFYDSKSWIVNVAGDYEILQAAGLSSKIAPIKMSVPVMNFVPTPGECELLAKEMTQQGYGKMFINAMTGNGTDDTYLKKLALANAQRNDFELGAASVRADGDEGLATLLADDYEPVLTHNYIVLSHSVETKDSKGNPITTTYYAIFRAAVDSETAFDIVASIGDPSRYNQIQVPVEFCHCGAKTFAEDMEKEITTAVPDLAVRGVLLHRAPARISIGRNAGLDKGDLVTFYSQRVGKDGIPYSKRISRARVCGVWDDEAQVNFECATSGNRKNGDIVVRTPDSPARFALMATWMPHVWGGQLMMDTKTGFARSGVIHHFLMDLGFSMTDKPGDKFCVLDDKHYGFEYKSPMFFNLGLGYGIGKTFMGLFDLMPFFLVQYEGALMMDLSTKIDETNGDDDGSAIFGSSVRIPVGLRFSINLKYPTKFVVEAGYAPCIGFGDEYKIVKETNKILGAKRDGIFLNAGFIF